MLRLIMQIIIGMLFASCHILIGTTESNRTVQVRRSEEANLYPITLLIGVALEIRGSESLFTKDYVCKEDDCDNSFKLSKKELPLDDMPYVKLLFEYSKNPDRRNKLKFILDRLLKKDSLSALLPLYSSYRIIDAIIQDTNYIQSHVIKSYDTSSWEDSSSSEESTENPNI